MKFFKHMHKSANGEVVRAFGFLSVERHYYESDGSSPVGAGETQNGNFRFFSWILSNVWCRIRNAARWKSGKVSKWMWPQLGWADQKYVHSFHSEWGFFVLFCFVLFFCSCSFLAVCLNSLSRTFLCLAPHGFIVTSIYSCFLGSFQLVLCLII